MARLEEIDIRQFDESMKPHEEDKVPIKNFSGELGATQSVLVSASCF